ncbi:hypothetical protein TRVL_05491 [Trypanosoma vivax]|nr:hypothetical protein TRVL_05491 [Trypanosoma vivax]
MQLSMKGEQSCTPFAASPTAPLICSPMPFSRCLAASHFLFLHSWNHRHALKSLAALILLFTIITIAINIIACFSPQLLFHLSTAVRVMTDSAESTDTHGPPHARADDNRPGDRIALGNHVIISGGGLRRLVHVCCGGKVRLGRSGTVQVETLVGMRFGEVVYYDSKNRSFMPTNEYPDLDITALEDHVDDGRDNRHLVDENNSQVLSNAEIAEIRRDRGVDVFLSNLVEKSATFHTKTAYSQEKYLRKKKKRYGVLYKVESVTPDGLAEIYLPTICPSDVEPELRALRLRADTLALILHHSDVHSSSRVFVYDKTNGHLEAALLTRLSREGRLFQLMDKTAQPNVFPAQAMGLPCIREVWKAIPRNPAFLRGEECQEKEESAASETKGMVSRSNCEISQWVRGIDARRMLQDRPADSLIIADDDGACIMSALGDMLPFLALNGHVVVYSPFLEDLTCLFEMLRRECVNICLSETWCRHHQVLPHRTHPTVRMSTAGGYLLTAIKVSGSVLDCGAAGQGESEETEALYSSTAVEERQASESYKRPRHEKTRSGEPAEDGL